MEDPSILGCEESGGRSASGERHHPGDAFSPLLFVLMIDPLIKILKRTVGDGAENLYFMHDLKASMIIQTAQTDHDIVKRCQDSGTMVINKKKSAIQLNVETPLPESLQDVPRLDDVTYKYLGFEMKKGEIARKK